jgi:hypothetical protein
VALLEGLPNASELPAVQRLLGDIYWNMLLLDRSREAYTQALALAQAGGFVEFEAQAQTGLGRVACAQADGAGAQEHWTLAQAIYAPVDSKAAAEVEKLLQTAAAECR